MHGPELTTTEFDFGWPHHSAAQCSNFPQLRQLPETPIPRLSSLLGAVGPAIRHLSQPLNSSGWLPQHLVRVCPEVDALAVRLHAVRRILHLWLGPLHYIRQRLH